MLIKKPAWVMCLLLKISGGGEIIGLGLSTYYVRFVVGGKVNDILLSITKGRGGGDWSNIT